MEKLLIELSPNVSYIPEVRKFVGRILRLSGFNDLYIYQLKTIITELCYNCIKYGSFKKNQTIKIDLEIRPENIKLVIENHGIKKLERGKIFRRNLKILSNEISGKFNGSPKRGKGLIIVKKYASNLRIMNTQKGTKIIINKKNGN